MHDKLGKLERIVDADVAHFQEVGFLHEEVREVQPSLGLRGAFERRVRYGIVLDALRKSELAVEGVNVSPRLIVAHDCKVQPLPTGREREVAIHFRNGASKILIVKSLVDASVGVERGRRAAQEAYRLAFLYDGHDGTRRKTADGKGYDSARGEHLVVVGVQRGAHGEPPVFRVDDIQAHVHLYAAVTYLTDVGQIGTALA